MISINIDLSHADENESSMAVRLIDFIKRYAYPTLLDLTVTTDEGLSLATTSPHFPVNNDLPPATVARIDFVEVGTRCHSCRHPLTSGSAYIVRESDDSEYPYGPSCIKRRVPDFKLHSYPDFTRASKVAPGEGERVEAAKEPDTVSVLVEEEYLQLRYQKLQHFKIQSYELLDKAYTRYLNEGILSGEDRLMITRLLKKLPTSKLPGLSLSNLQACYAYDHWLTEAIGKLQEGKQDYLTELRSALRNRLFLTSGQVGAANKWLEKLKMPALDPSPFSWAIKPVPEGLKTVDMQETSP